MAYGKKLTDDEIAERMVELHNLRLAHKRDLRQIIQLKAENKQLKQRVSELENQLAYTTETLTAQIEELRIMVFGRKKRPRISNDSNKPSSGNPPRDRASFKRELPANESITSEEHYSINTCHHCNDELVDKEEYVRYIEDIYLAALDNLNQFKSVIRQTIERGYCRSCGKFSSAKDLRGQEVSLGPNIRLLVCYLVTLRDHSYDQVQHLLLDLYNIKLSDGEISEILDNQRLKLLSEYEKLKDVIRAGPAIHMDESRWKIQSEGSGYVWSISSTISSNVVFKLADSRGKGNAEDLLGKNYQGIGITDRYSAYKHLFNLHQICWAHIFRNAKLLTHLENLEEDKQINVKQFHDSVEDIYSKLRQYLTEDFDQKIRNAYSKELKQELLRISRPNKLDPKKLTDLKAGIIEYLDCLFVCLTHEGIPADNNRAERDIRKLVMKRAKSLGCKTTKGARTLEVLLSVYWSTYNRDRDNFFSNINTLISPA